MMCKRGTWIKMCVKVPADLSCTGEDAWREKNIDACIADLVGALQAAGIDMRASCCGHGRGAGRIDLQDGRTLIVISGQADRRGKVSEEIWKDVVGFEGFYQASSLGRVKRVIGYQCRKERILKPQQHRSGYLSVSLSRDGQVSRKSVHRMVSEAHVGLAPEGCEANHRNGNVTDNRVANLEWVTKSENNKHAYRVLGRDPPPVKGEANGRAKNTRENVLEIRKHYATGDYTQRELGRMFGVSDVCISLIVRRETWQHVA